MRRLTICPVTGCKHEHPRTLLMCRMHWRALPKRLRDDVWRAYRHDGVLSGPYQTARAAALNYFDPDPYQHAEASH